MTKNIDKSRDASGVESIRREIGTQKHIQMLDFSEQDLSRSDLQAVIALYKAAFAEPPWNESWSTEEILGDLKMAQSQNNFVMVVAKVNMEVVGFAWGYDIPLEKFPFLKDVVPSISNCSYMDEIAVDPAFRKRGVGCELVESYEQAVRARTPSYDARKILRTDDTEIGVVLRTDVKNVASMKLFCREGFDTVKDAEGHDKTDPEYPTRVYLYRK